MQSKTFCTLPFTHLHTQPSGKLKPCCISGNFKGSVNINSTSLSEAYNSEEMKALRKDMIEGRRNRICDICYSKEDRGEISPRQSFNQKYTELPEVYEDYSVNLDFQYLDIRSSNLCNFRCKTCTHEFSSRWYEHSGQIYHTNRVDMFPPAADTRVIKNRDSFIDELTQYSSNVKFVYFAGGEPLIMKEHFQLLTWLKDNTKVFSGTDPEGNFFDDAIEELAIHYNTNLSVLNFEKHSLLEIWNNIKNRGGAIHLAISCDGLFELGEYIREGFKHDTFVNNVNKIKENGFSYSLQFTVSTLNVFKVFESIEQFKQLDIIKSPEEIDFHYVTNPPWFAINNFSDENKERVRELFYGNWNYLPEKTKSEFSNLLKFLNGGRDRQELINKMTLLLDNLQS